MNNFSKYFPQDYNSRPEAVVQALQVLEVREQLENNPAGDADMNSDEMDEGEKALLREMCNVSIFHNNVFTYKINSILYIHYIFLSGCMEEIGRGID